MVTRINAGSLKSNMIVNYNGKVEAIEIEIALDFDELVLIDDNQQISKVVTTNGGVKVAISVGHVRDANRFLKHEKEKEE